MPTRPNYVCQNPNCSSFGTAHYGCKCGDPAEGYAEGGIVCHLKGLHHPKCEYFAEGGEAADNHEFQNNPDLAVDHAIVNNGLHHTLTKTGNTKSEDPARAFTDFLESSRRGNKALPRHTEGAIDPKSPPHKRNPESESALTSHLDNAGKNLDLALETGGALGDHLPLHHAALSAKLATASGYLNSIKPQPTQIGPMDKPIPPSAMQQKAYARQVAIAENPNLIYQHAKEGTLQPSDLMTLSTLYPKLKMKMQDRAFEKLTDAHASGRELSHKQKRVLGALVGQHLNFEQSPQAIAAIMHANAPQMQQPQGPQKGPKKASSTELTQINKVNAMYQTPDEARQLDNKAKI